jgi:hypothetical protein
MVHPTTAEMHAKFVGVLRTHYAEFVKVSSGKPEIGAVLQRDFYGSIFQTVLGFKPGTVYGVFHGKIVHGCRGNCSCDSWLVDSIGTPKCAGELIEQILGNYCTSSLELNPEEGPDFKFHTWRFVEKPAEGFVPNIWRVGEQKLLALAS